VALTKANELLAFPGNGVRRKVPMITPETDHRDELLQRIAS
jgi:hypothetical protein